MDGFTRLPGPMPASPPGRADLGRRARALGSAGRAVPDDPLARRLHLAVAELERPGLSALGPRAFAAALAPLHLALSALEPASLDAASPAELVRLILRIDDAGEVLETPDLRPVPTDLLAGRLRELYATVVRTRAASGRLHRAWTATAGGPGR
ncbi:hypothetical protein ACRYCC_11475 [Actinomadura scrupuli]|uniref:hypothetical protein n=1 Tax=Actinomadura scrupuli TaxID=559629 RepID=UPI003D96D879